MHRSAALRWVAAALVAVVTAVVVASDLATLHRRARSLGPERQAVVAARDLPLGTTVRDDDVTTRPVHASQLPEGAATDLDELRGRVVVVPLLAGAHLTARHLAPATRDGLSGVVPVGTRAVRVEPLSAPRLHPGDLVDVLALFDGGSTASVGVAARGALVVDVDDGTPAQAGGAGVTLLVETGEVERVAEAVALGALTLALSAPEERGDGDAAPSEPGDGS